MNIDILCVGKLKEPYWRQAQQEYAKRLSRYCKLNIIEVPDSPIPDRASQVVQDKIIAEEGAALRRRLTSDSTIICLDSNGILVTSMEFAEIMMENDRHGHAMSFLIGGSLGLEESLKAQAFRQISFGRVTFPHQLARVMLLEQVYRGFKINCNETYHK